MVGEAMTDTIIQFDDVTVRFTGCHGFCAKAPVIAIEPMITAGSWRVKIDDDGWTARTEDGKLSAHFEYSVAVTPDGQRVLGLEE